MAITKIKLIPKSLITDKANEIDSVKKIKIEGDKAYIDLLFNANRAWDSLRTFREERERCKNYTYGKQWNDIIHYEGRDITEEQYINEQGTPALKNNLIRRLLRTVMGVNRGQDKEPVCVANDRDEQKLGETMSIALQYNWKANRMNEIKGRIFEEFLISSGAFLKETVGWRNDRYDCWTDIVDPKRIFFDGNMQDIRHWDLSMIGEIHDLSFDELASTFARKKSDYAMLKNIYNNAVRRDFLTNYFDDIAERHKLKNIDFLVPEDTTRCRVIEIWTKETKVRYHCHDFLTGEYYKVEEDAIEEINRDNAMRIKQGTDEGMDPSDIPTIETEWFIDSYWYYRFLTPFGQVLDEGETPYAHKSHPYVIKLYPFIDGETHSFVSDFIDQQRYINRLITLNDFVIRASAKGVLMIPEEAIPDGMTPEDFAHEWTKFNGVIVYRSKNVSQLPQQIANKSTNIGISELLQVELNLMEDVSGITGALQGKPGLSGTSAALYQQQQQNASSSLLDILESFDSFIIEDSLKKVKNMQQYYDSKRIMTIVGAGAQGYVVYDPDKIKDVEFDLSIYESANTPTYRMIANDFLMEIWRAGQISLEQLLASGSFPFADKLLQSIRSTNEQMQAMQPGQANQPQGYDMQQVQQATGQPNANAVNQLSNAIRG